MEVFNRIFTWLRPKKTPIAPCYGRGIHALPNPCEHELFDASATAFIQREPLLGYRYFFDSLVHIPLCQTIPHLTLREDENFLSFELLQGSAIIRGEITPEEFQAQVKIARSDGLHVALKRRFLERNFQFTYSRFSEENGVFVLSIRLDNATITPQKIFFPLREIALNADFEKEFIASEFDESFLLEYDHLPPLDPLRCNRLHQMMLKWISNTRNSLVGLLSNDNSGMTSFSYLALLLQIDYLLIPHKRMARKINEKISGYFIDDEKLTEDKNAELERYLSELETMDLKTFCHQFYIGTYTFSPFDQAMHDEIALFIDESLNKVRWYKNNHANYVISAIYRYIALYILYNYGLHPSLRALLHLHVQVYAAEFFAGEGETPLYDPLTNHFETDLIGERIDAAIEPYTDRFKGLKSFADELNYSDLDHFSQSFYMHVKNLDYLES